MGDIVVKLPLFLQEHFQLYGEQIKDIKKIICQLIQVII